MLVALFCKAEDSFSKMVVWSSVCVKNAIGLNCARSLIFRSKNALNSKTINYVSVRNSGDHHKTFVIKTSGYMWKKFKDLANFYLLLGIIPLGLLIAYCNIFIGPAELIEIPEGYVPKHWEYHSHPITRFISKHMASPQQVFEINCHHIFREHEHMKMIQLESKIRDLMSERGDYQAWFFKKPQVKYPRIQEAKVREREWNELGHSPTFVVED